MVTWFSSFIFNLLVIFRQLRFQEPSPAASHQEYEMDYLVHVEDLCADAVLDDVYGYVKALVCQCYSSPVCLAW